MGSGKFMSTNMFQKPPNPFKQKKSKAGKNKAVKKINQNAFSGGWVVIHKTETIQDNLNPTWRPFVVDLAALCYNNLDQPFMVEVWDYDENGSHDLIGANKVTMRELTTLREVRLENTARIGFSSTAGLIKVLKCAPV